MEEENIVHIYTFLFSEHICGKQYCSHISNIQYCDQYTKKITTL